LRELRRFDPACAPLVSAWIRTSEEAEAWASLTGNAVTPELFARWHADDDVHPFLLYENELPVGYGELWSDDGAREVELARLVVAPDERGRGLGSELAAMLCAEARRRFPYQVWLRVVPENTVAIAAYARAGFVRASAADEEAFNRDQPRTYVWMRAE
jgi:[ribosomal protein S18]-alanine N-acetyltransferase